MEDRYEIRGKIGQGGLGAVYRGYDLRMNREVAIKRISIQDDPNHQEESTRQLLKEAGALASLQHPHIVTIYDVGVDEDGPYVVMELISGKTLDELVELAPLTWNDFRELALQTQEALIAAQELDLIHGDLKPENLMLTWLPSGKFQIKIVDFGLATLAHSQSREELQAIDSVFGSIYFMAPEQFEREPMDARTDIYAMACVYYHALTGIYPFRGATDHEVMDAHLHHTITPLQEIRADIPVWVCDWIMWQVNRMPSDRPATTRESLQLFLQNSKLQNPPMSTGRPPLPKGVHRPRSLHASVPGAPPVQPVANPATHPVITAPQPLEPPEGSKPSVHTGPIDLPPATPTAPIAMPTGQVHATKPLPTVPIKKKPLNRVQVGLIAGLSITFLVISFFLFNQIKKSQASKRYGNMLSEAGDVSVTEIPMSGAEFSRFLQDLAETTSEEKQQDIVQVLGKAKANDGTDIDDAAVKFATTSTEILPEVRAALIRESIGKRIKASMIPELMDFARSTKDSQSASAVFEAIRPVAGDDQFDALLEVTQFSPNADMRKAAEESASEVMAKSRNKGKLLGKVAAIMGSIKDQKIKDALTRIRQAGGA